MLCPRTQNKESCWDNQSDNSIFFAQGAPAAHEGQYPFPDRNAVWTTGGMQKSQASSLLCIPDLMGTATLAPNSCCSFPSLSLWPKREARLRLVHIYRCPFLGPCQHPASGPWREFWLVLLPCQIAAKPCPPPTLFKGGDGVALPIEMFLLHLKDLMQQMRGKLAMDKDGNVSPSHWDLSPCGYCYF